MFFSITFRENLVLLYAKIRAFQNDFLYSKNIILEMNGKIKETFWMWKGGSPISTLGVTRNGSLRLL